MKHSVRAGLLLAFLLAAGCFDQGEEFAQLEHLPVPSGAVPVPAGSPAEVFPLEPGARFDYAARFGLGAGQFDGEAILSVTGAWQQGERRIIATTLRSRYFGHTRADRYVFTRDADWLGLFEKDPPDKVTRFMPNHLAKGDTWPVATGEGTGTATVEAIEDVRVPAGTYPACARVRYLNPQRHTDMALWLAPHVGLVKADVQIRVGPLPLRGTLTLTRAWAPL